MSAGSEAFLGPLLSRSAWAIVPVPRGFNGRCRRFLGFDARRSVWRSGSSIRGDPLGHGGGAGRRGGVDNRASVHGRGVRYRRRMWGRDREATRISEGGMDQVAVS